MTTNQSFIDASRHHLVDGYLPRIRRALEKMADGDLWWRPNPASNSVGNLILHLEGNLRQWIVTGVGGEPDTRTRDAEFAARDGADAATLLEHLARAVHDADTALAGLDPERLAETRTIQGNEVSVLDAIYHAVEHFSMHTGQILYIAKLRTAQDLGLYRPHGERMSEAW